MCFNYRDDLAAMGIDVSVLDLWYKKDSNAVPPISILQPISSILTNFNNKVSSIHNSEKNKSKPGFFQ